MESSLSSPASAPEKPVPRPWPRELGVSLSLVYKWTEPAAGDGSGSRNPLDRLQKVIELSGDTGIVGSGSASRTACGHFVRNPFADGSGNRACAHGNAGDHLAVFRAAEPDFRRRDRPVDQKGWKPRKSARCGQAGYAEGFVVCCEKRASKCTSRSRPVKDRGGARDRVTSVTPTPGS